MKSRELKPPRAKKINGVGPPDKESGGASPAKEDAPRLTEDQQRKATAARELEQVLRGISRPVFMSARPLKPGRYKNDPAGWKIELEGPDAGIAIGPRGERMEFVDFLTWAYGISKEQALLDIQSVLASKD